MDSNSSVRIRDPYTVLTDVGTDHDAHSIARILAKCAPDTGLETEFPVRAGAAIWGAEHYGLERSSLFRMFSKSQRDAVLKRLGLGILEEAQYIELAGMSYTAKMSLLADDHQQRQLYGFFAADEARHLRMIGDLVGAPKPGLAEQNSFLQYLSQIIQTETRLPLMFLSQVILEGWGLTHYATLAERALDPQVRNTLNAIVADEARHHGSGVVMFNEKNLTAEESERLENWMAQFIEMIRIGPFAVIAQLAEENHGLSEAQVHQFLLENKFEDKVQTDLQLMTRLMRKANAEGLLSRCERKGLLMPPNIEQTGIRIASAF